MRPTLSRTLLVCLPLLLACGHAAANQSRPADIGNACPESSTSEADRSDDAEEPTGTAAPVRRTVQKPRPAASATPRTGGNERTTPPRWHSFLPGMIR